MKNVFMDLTRSITSFKVTLVSLLLLSSCFFNACIPVRKVGYFKELKGYNTFIVDTSSTQKQLIRKGDRLIVEVFSVNERVNSVFRGNREQEVEYTNYIVDELGYISFPFIGNVQVEGITQEEASMRIESELMEYLNQLVVRVRIQNNQISLLGEVRLPGVYEFHEERIELLKAIALAGGIDDYGKKTEVHVIRNEGDRVLATTLDLTSADYLSSSDYFVYPGDIIVVGAVNQKYRQLSAINWTTIFALVTTTITVYYFISTVGDNN